MMIRLAGSNYLGFFLAAPVLAAAAALLVLASGSVALALAVVLLVLGMIMTAAATYHVARVHLFLRRFPPPGRLIRVHGEFMHLLAEGEAAKGATVVWLPGSHDSGMELEHLHRAVMKTTRSILIDRAGSGWSAPARRRRMIETEVEELAALLDGAGEQGPFLLVGHSMGGTLAANFVARHPDKTAGVILLDMGCTDINLYAEHLPGPKTIGAEPWLPVLAAFGVLWHILPARHPKDFAGSVENERRLGFKAQPKTHVGWISAFHAICADPLAFVRNPGDLGDVPLFAVTPLQNFAADEKILKPFVPHLSELRLKNLINLRFEATKANAKLSRQGELRFAPPGATHSLPYEVPEFVIGLVEEMLARVAKGSNERLSRPSPSLQSRLEESLARHGVPGASVAVLRDGEITAVAAGSLNVETGVAATPDAVFQIGSVTKSFTATLAMMLAEEGKLRLDDRVVDHLPDFTLADAAAARAITIRHLLCHTNGIDGDRIVDTGHNDDAVALFVAGLKEAAVLHPVNAFFSYSNVGYIVLGRILEVIEEKSWDRILQDRLLTPLGLSSAVMSAETAVYRRVAAGHESAVDGSHRLAGSAFLPRSNGPSGTTLAMTASDLVRFAQFHLDGGVAASGQRLLSEASCRAMRQPQVATPQSRRYSGWGLGWMLFYWQGADVFGHDGGWSGQSCYLRLSPAAKLAVAVQANGGFTAGVFRDIAGPILKEHANFVIPGPPVVGTAFAGDLTPYAGRYGRFGQAVDLAVSGAALKGTLSGPYAGDRPPAVTVTLIDRERAACVIEGINEPMGAYFLDFDDAGRPGYFHVTERAFKREE